MSPRKKDTPSEDRTDHAMRDEEVMRANRELAAYFKGRRTEREARAALKIIKAFIRDRERLDPAKRRPLPGANAARPVSGSVKESKAAIVLKAIEQA